jgi:hypothetical protein
MIKSIGHFLRILKLIKIISDFLFIAFINIIEAVKLPEMLHELSKPEHIFSFELSNLIKEFKLKSSIISCDIKSPIKHCTLRFLSFRLTFSFEGACTEIFVTGKKLTFEEDVKKN